MGFQKPKKLPTFTKKKKNNILNFKNIEKRAKKKEKKHLLKIYAIIFLSSFFFLLSSFTIHAQDSIKKPKIGLVLSGGGAKGFGTYWSFKSIGSQASKLIILVELVWEQLLAVYMLQVIQEKKLNMLLSNGFR